LEDFSRRTIEARTLPDGVEQLLPPVAKLPGYSPLMALRSAVSLTSAALQAKPTLDIPAEQVRADGLRMAALVPVLLMQMHRHHLGKAPVVPDSDLGYAAAYLQMLTGERPEPRAARA